MTDLDSLKTKLVEIKQRGFIKTLRKGNTGVGYTLETLLGLDENNDCGADFGDIELKAKRDGSNSSKVSSLTQAPIWLVKPRQFIETHGEWNQDQQRFNFYCTVKHSAVNNRGLTLKIRNDTAYGDTLYLHSQKMNCDLAKWPLFMLSFRQEQKLNKMVVISAKTKGKGASELFHYHEADFYSDPCPKRLRKIIEDGVLVVEPRMWFNPQTNKLRDRGTAFRISKNKVHLMYEHHENIL